MAYKRDQTGKLCCRCYSYPRVGTTGYCRECYNFYKREWYKKHREQEIQRCSMWNKKNARRVADNMQKARERRPEHFKKYSKEWFKKNKDRTALTDKKKRAKRRAAKTATIKKITVAEWNQIQENQQWRCFYCGGLPEKLTMDHKLALARGGDHSVENVVAACGLCNNRKNARLTANEYMQIVAKERSL